jgi:hypothetical protein
MSNNNSWLINGSGIGAQSASLNTISLSNITGYTNNITLGDFEFAFNEDVKKYEVYEISQDLLALSVCWARYRKTRNDSGPQPTITKLLDSELFRLVTEEDIAQANIIRDHYSKRIMMWKLKNIKLTPFREDMNTFIHSNGKTFKESMIPLVYRLPEFYEYDVEFEKMSFDYNKEVKRHDDSLFVSERKQLKFVKQLSVNNRRVKRKEYWFSDSFNNLVTFSIEPSNPLISMLDMTLKNNEVNVVGKYKKISRDGNEYLKVDRFSFV